jgi:hypothetical protein
MKSPQALESPLIPISLRQMLQSMRPTLTRNPGLVGEGPSGPWVGKREIARRFDVCARTIDHWIARGMPHFKPSVRMVRFSISDCDEWYRRQFSVHGTGSRR